MSRYVIRPMKEQDIESIIAIDRAIDRAVDREGGRAGEDRAGFWRGLLSIYAPAPEAAPGGSAPPQPHLCEVAETVGPAPRVVGFIIGDVQSWQFGIPRHGRIVTIGVHPEHRRQGLATRLAEALLGTFRKMGLPSVQCLTRPGDPLGDFFRSAGFTESAMQVLERSL